MVKNRLWLALRLLDLPLRSFPSYPAGQAVCILEKQKVVAANSVAINAGVRIGMDATTAHLLSDCITYQRDGKQEQDYLSQLAEYLYTFTPYIHIHRSSLGPDSGFLLEISRCLRLFGGLIPLCERIFSSLQDTPYAHGLAHTQEGAWLLSYESYNITGTEDTSMFVDRLNRISVDMLFEWPDTVTALKRTGFSSLADIARQIQRQSISGIRKRFGYSFADYITRIFGIEQDFQQPALFSKPVETYQPKEFFFETFQLDYPVMQIDQLHFIFEQILKKLSDYLKKRKLSCQKIEWRFFDIHQNSHAFFIHCAKAQNEWKIFHDLTLIQLENKQLPFAVDAIELICRDLQKGQEQNQSLNFDGSQNNRSSNNDLALIEGKLKARLGDHAVFKISYKDSHIPEESYQRISAFTPSEQQLPLCHKTAPRPTWLFEKPIPIKVQQRQLFWRGNITLLVGPERVESQWWENHTVRDYYIAKREDELRIWLFQDLLSGGWFVQGVFAG